MVFLFSFYSVFLLGQTVNGQVVDSNIVITDTAINLLPQKPIIDSIIGYAFSYMGRNYRRGGTGATGFDCSGYTMMVFKNFGIKLPHTSAGQALVGTEIKIKNVRPGDLVFFRGRNRNSKRIGHVGIVISKPGEPVAFIHSSVTGGVRIDKVEFPYYKTRYIKAVRILK